MISKVLYIYDPLIDLQIWISLLMNVPGTPAGIYWFFFFFFPFKASFTEDFSVSNNVVFQIWQVIDSDLMFVVIIVQHKSLLNYILHL